MKLKKIDWIKKFIKLCIAYPSFGLLFKKIRKDKTNRAIFIGSPIHGNLGDHLITTECLKYIKTLDFDEIIEIPEFLYELFPDKINFNKNDFLFISGGGWMGDLYEDEIVVEEIISKWKENNTIILPQTISFGNGTYSSINKLKDIIKANKNLVICVREENSYNLCINRIGCTSENCILLPDMALLRLCNIYKNNNEKYNKIIFSLRNDKEKNYNSNNIENIFECLKSKNIDIYFSSSVINKKIVPLRKRNKVLEEKIKEFSKSDLVITDRLHSMVFAILAGRKCIAIDNTTHKVTGVYNKWLKGLPGLIVLDSMEELNMEIINSMLEKVETPIEKDFKDEFKNINSLIKEMKK